MTHVEITSAIMFRLIQQGTDPTEPIYAVSLRDVISAVVRRQGEEAMTLSNSDLMAAQDEVRAVFEHDRRDKELFEIALDAWEIRRKL